MSSPILADSGQLAFVNAVQRARWHGGGMARVFAYFMEREVSMEDRAIFEDISKTIFNALEKTRKQNASKTTIAQSTFEIALRQLV